MKRAPWTARRITQVRCKTQYAACRRIDALRARLGRQPWLLSTQTAQEKRAIWGGVKLPGTVSSRWTRRLRQVPRSWIVIAAVGVVAALVGGFFFPPEHMSPGAETAIIGKCVEVNIAVVGIIVPLLILVIEFSGREAGVTDLIMENSGVLRHVVLVLVALAIVVLAYARTAAYEAHCEGCLRAATVSAALAGTLAIVAETARFARRTIASLNSEAIYDALKHRLTTQLQKSVDHELDHRLGRRMVEEMAREHAVPTRPIGRYVARQEVALTADTTGLVTDIRLDKLQAFCTGLTTAMRGKDVKAYLTVSLHDQVQQGQPIAYVPRAQEDPNKLEETLNSAMIVTSARPRAPELRPALDHLRDMSVRAIQELSEGAFERLLSLYMSVADFHTELVSATGSEAPSPASLADFFPEWPFIRLVERDLDVVIDHAVRSESYVYTSRIASYLYYIARGALDSRAPRMFQLATGLFQAIYKRAQAAQNARAKDLVDLYMIDQLAMFGLVPALENTEPESVAEVRRFLQILTCAIIGLAKASIDFKDLQGFANTVRAGEQLLEHYHPRPQLQRELFSAIARVETTPEGTVEHEHAVEREANIDYLLRLEDTYATEWKDMVFLLGAYVVDLHDRGVLEERSTEALLKIVTPEFTDPAALLHALSAAVSPPYQMTLFDYMEDRRRTQPFVPQRKYYLLYTLLGTALPEFAYIQESQHEVAFLSPYHVAKIRDAADHLEENRHKWLRITGVDFELHVKRFVSFHERMLTNQENRQQEEMIRSDLSKATVALFDSRARAAARETSAMRHWLEEYQALFEVDALPDEEREVISRGMLEEKATFVSNEQAAFATQVGKQLGQAVADGFDSELLGRLLDAAKDGAQPRTMPLPRALAAAHHWAEQTVTSMALLVVPARTAPSLLRLAGFLYPEGIADDHPTRALYGFYQSMPILAVRDQVVGNCVLGIDFARACTVAVTAPEIEVRTLTDQEIETKMQEDPDLSERTLRLRVWVAVWQHFKFESIDNQGLLLLQLAKED